MSRNRGFTLVEIMIVVAIIGVLAVIAIPSFMRARRTSQTNTCMNNMRLVSGAIQQWALETMRRGDDAVDAAALTPYLTQGRLPYCPINNEPYVMNTVDGGIACNNYDIAEHPASIGWVP